MDSKETTNFFSKITIISFLASICVIFIHAYNIKPYGISNNSVTFYIEWFISQNIGRFAVPYFFMISGFLFFRNYNFSKIKLKLYSRFHTLFIPYILWNIIFFLFYLTLTNLPFISKSMNMDTVTLDLPNIIAAVFLYKYNYVFWYIFQLIIFVILAPIIYAIIKNKSIGAIMLILLVLLNIFSITIPIIYIDSLLYYIIGSYLGIHFKEKIISTKISISYCIGVFSLSQIGIWINSIQHAINLNVINLLLLTASIFFVFDYIHLFEIKKFYKKSFFIYASHTLIIELVKKPLLLISPTNDLFALVNYFLSVGITLLIIYYASMALERIIPSFYRYLNGNRTH